MRFKSAPRGLWANLPPANRRSQCSRRLRCRLEHLEDRALLTINGQVMDALGSLVPVDTRVAGKLGDSLAYLAADYQMWAGSAGQLNHNPTTAYLPSSAQPLLNLIRFGTGTVGVVAIATGVQSDRLALEMAALGAQVTGSYGVMVSAMVPDAALAGLANLADLRFARPEYLPVVSAGKVESQAVAAQKADIGGTTFGVDGSGLTIGLLSDSFNNKSGYSADVASGDLPPGVQVLTDLSSGGTDEGRAMAQLVHDVAPASKLAFASAFLGEAAFAQGIINLAKPVTQGGAGAQVIADDVFYFDEPIFQDGVVAQAVNTAANTYGAAYFSSAGNQANHAFQTAWNGTTASPAGMPANSMVQDFGGATGIFLPISGNLTTTFQWDSPYASAGNGSPGSSNQLDLYFYGADKTTLLGTITDNTIGADPTKIFQANFGTQAYMVVRLAAGNAPTTFKYINVGGGTMPYNAGASFGHNQAAGGAGVAASAYNGTPAYGNSPPAADSYTSLGGTAILFDPAGNRLATPDLRPQPRFTGVDGIDTTFFGSDSDGNGLPNFYGTSAAAPDVAGVAALLKQAVPSLTPAQIYAALAATAIDMNTPGYDYRTGAGLIQAHAALANVTANSITGKVFQDTNGDGIRNDGDTAIIGQTVFLDTNSNGTIDSGTTAALTSADVPKIIPDGSTGNPSRVTSALAVSDVPGRVTKVTVTLSINHARDSDLSVNLISPSGMRIPLFSNVGGASPLGFSNTVLDDAAATPIRNGTAPFTGTFHPLVALAGLIGENPNGTWQLEARDHFSGNIQAWSLVIQYAETSTTTNAAGNYSFTAAPPSSYYGTYSVRTLVSAPAVLSLPRSPYDLDLTNTAPLTGKDFGLTLPLLTITANDVTRVYGAPDPSLGVTYSGFLGTDTPSVLGGTLNLVDTQADPTTTVGLYAGAILGSGQTSSSYRLNYVPGNLTVLAAPTMTNLVASANPAWFGDPVTFTTTVIASAPSTATPSGAVQFLVDGQNFGAPVTLTGGTASLTVSDLSVGSHTVTAAYSADPNFVSSVSTILTQTINDALAAPTVATQPANLTVNAGETASFHATATGNPAPTIQWMVSSDNGQTWTSIPGASATTYSFTTAASDNGSRYQAVFTNSVGTATTSAATLTVHVPLPTGSASFLLQDALTQGTWKTAYGADGFNISQDGSANNPSIPAYASLSITDASGTTWKQATTDSRALQKSSPTATDRIAGTWYSSSSFSIDVKIKDGKTHQLTLYALDWDSTSRTETIQAIDDATGAVLDTQTLASFHQGVYLAWNIQGNITFKVTNTGSSPNAVVSGLFFGAAPIIAGQATFLKQDITTQGNWKAAYGAEGFDLSQDGSGNNPSLPSYASLSFSTAKTTTWSSSTTDVRALQKAALSATDRIAGAWYNNNAFAIDLKTRDGKTHQVALYAIDWDSNTRAQTVQVIDDATGTVLDTQTLAGFHEGVYLAWNIQGNVTFKVTNTGPSNAVLSGLFFGGAPLVAGQATFVTQDTATQGTWKGVYGADGFNISQDRSAENPSFPGYATVNLSNAAGFVWNASTTDFRALQKVAANAPDRIAGTWYNADTISTTISINDGKTHQLALYAVDWDNSARVEMVQVIDTATGSVLDSRALASFRNGVYLVWNIAGSVTVKVINTGSSNAVLSGLFWG